MSEALSGAGAPQEDLDRRIAVREALAGLATLRTALTAVTPMPLATWAADTASHGGGAAELAIGGGSAGLVGLLAKGGAVVVTAGVLAAGVGTVEHRWHARPGTPHASHAAREHGTASPDNGLVAATPAAAVDLRAEALLAPAQRGSRHRHRRRAPILAPGREQASEAPVRLRPGAADGEGRPSRHDISGGEHDGRGDGGGPGPGGRRGRDRLPGDGTATGPGPGDDQRSGDRHGPVGGSADDRSGTGSGAGDGSRSSADGDDGSGSGTSAGDTGSAAGGEDLSGDDGSGDGGHRDAGG